MAGPLYSRMYKVADVDATLYYWLQEPDSVTHSKRTPTFWHDNVLSAAENFQFTLNQGIVPYRNYFGLTASVRDEGRGLHHANSSTGSAQAQFTISAEDIKNYQNDVQNMKSLIRRLAPSQRFLCKILYFIRSGENLIYNRRIHSMK